MFKRNTLATRRIGHAPPSARKADKPVAEIADAVSATTQRLVDGIRDEFGGYVDEFATFAADTSELATRFMKAARAWMKDTEGTFVDFVRTLDPTVPAARADYRKHATYQAADYLRRPSTAKPKGRIVSKDKRPVSPATALVRLVATVMPIVDPTGSIMAAFVREMHWSDEQAQRLKERAAKLGAISLPPRTLHALEARAKAA